jgi:hypothetical protein
VHKTVPDRYLGGKWLQRYNTPDEKYTWTISGVLWNNIKERCTESSATQAREKTYLNSENLFSSFNDFVIWHRAQVGYGLGYDLDSDILKIGDKVYSADTCVLLPPALNRFIQSRKRPRSQALPTGICKVKNRLWVRCVMKDDVTNKNFDTVNKMLPLYDLERCVELYKHGYIQAIDIWINRLVCSGRYSVDDRVIDFLLDLKHKVKDSSSHA